MSLFAWQNNKTILFYFTQILWVLIRHQCREAEFLASVLQSWSIVSLPCTGHCSQHAMCIGVFNPYCHSRGSILPLRRTRGQGGAGPAGGCAGSLPRARGTGRMKKHHGPPPLLLFTSSSLSIIRVVSSAYLRLLIFLLAILIPAWFLPLLISSLLSASVYRDQGSAFRPSGCRGDDEGSKAEISKWSLGSEGKERGEATLIP